jgi:Mn-dependent DtxR family transcriptional regulator
MSRRGAITASQRELYELILALHEHRGEYPSQRYLAQFLGVSLKTVQERLASLYRRGWLCSPTPAGASIRAEILSIQQ